MMLKENPTKVTKSELQKRLMEQAKRLEEATPYRKRTVQLATKVLDLTQNTSAFSSKSLTLSLVKILLRKEDEDRQKDVAKMLYTQHGYLYNELNYSDEFKKLVEESKRQCKNPTIKFVRVNSSLKLQVNSDKRGV